MLEHLSKNGVVLSLSSNLMSASERVVFETYPAAVASAIGFSGNYKRSPGDCLQQAEEYLADHGVKLEFSDPVRKFCLEYRTTGKSNKDPDPDAADAFLCLVAAICFRESLVDLCCGGATSAVLDEEACIITLEESRLSVTLLPDTRRRL